MPKALPHAHSTFQPADEGTFGEDRNVFEGRLRIVRSARRARLLKRRGVELDCYNNPLAFGNGPTRFWAWYETYESVAARAEVRKTRNLMCRAIRKAKREHGLNWVHGLLESTFYQTHARYDFSTIEARVLADLDAKGYSLQVDQPSDIQRAARESPNMRLYYLDPTLTGLAE